MYKPIERKKENRALDIDYETFSNIMGWKMKMGQRIFEWISFKKKVKRENNK